LLVIESVARNSEVTLIGVSSRVRDFKLGELGLDSILNVFPVYFIGGVLGIWGLEVDNYSIVDIINK
jgi:hypothetical protein